MNYIIAAGYCGTGSSIPNDLLRECEGYKTFDAEFKLLTGIDGVIDLEKALIDNPYYLKTATAISRFKNFCAQICNPKWSVYDYNKIFCDNFGNLIDDFCRRIIDRYYICGSSQFSVSDLKRDIFKVGARGYRLELYRKYINEMEVPFIDITPDQFYSEVRKLLNDIFDRYEKDGYHTCVLDQALMPFYSSRLPLYFPGGKMIVVDWDPRDVAVGCIRDGDAYGNELRKNLDAEFFAKWYRLIRRNFSFTEGMSILQIRYEELALNYENSKNKVFNFLGVDPSCHKYQRQYFDPQRSASKIGRWKTYKADEYFTQQDWLRFCSEVRELLPEYCFDRNGD